ncbi:NDP-hexose 2,3-dehydratase family protein [Desulfovibrio sp. TomC]|uniref:NDP-hexose 2,3-dehydratase family protein n=1 Tax=Desulfovibrio sp. TomC TaxID=1562888 RepID=UPI000575966E|nr:NDP-hexose 2,3-dehydratase family protein [Desulfovibrio sp. TomC]KHK01110.1 2,3-dehydratase [Desulfovibrio sp. TomC]
MSTAAVCRAFLGSCRAMAGVFPSLDAVRDWFAAKDRCHRFEVRQVPLAGLDQWSYAPGPLRLVHRTGRFFSIEGIRVETDFGPAPTWDQPIINQPEVGILGLLAREIDGVLHFLMQAKMEPGNVNILQLSPTVQATHSNYSRVHQGSTPRYLEYFTEPGLARVLLDQLQPEQGARFLRKRNRNMVVAVDGPVPMHEDFCWLTLGQIKALLAHDNIVNMDARTVVSLIPLADPDEPPNYGLVDGVTGFGLDIYLSFCRSDKERHTMDRLMAWLTDGKARHAMHVSPLPLDALRGWMVTDTDIRHESGLYFSVIGVDVAAKTRESTRWSQPLLHHKGEGLVGFLCQRHGGVLHFLVRGSLEPGNRDGMEIGPTVACSEVAARSRRAGAPRFLKQFLDPGDLVVRYDAVQSEEGGRFHHFQNRYMVVELPPGKHLDLPGHFIWMTLGQLWRMARHGHVSIEARNLMACLGLLETLP